MGDLPIPQAQNAITMERRSVTRDQSRSIIRNVMRNMTSLLTPPTLKTVRKLSELIVRNSTPRFTTAPRLLVMILTREMLKLVTKVTHLDLTARTMWNTSVIRFLSNMRERFQERSARPLLIQPTLRSARISSMSSVTRLMFRLTIVPRLLVMIPMLLITIPMDMDITRELLMLNQRLSQREKLLSTRRERLHQKPRLIQDMRVTMVDMPIPQDQSAITM